MKAKNSQQKIKKGAIIKLKKEELRLEKKIRILQNRNNNDWEEVAGILLKILLKNLNRIKILLDNGLNNYGICEDCGCKIPEERLRYNPSMPKCINCAAIHEQQEKKKYDFLCASLS
ncbi:TraR/DksA family transcriptional regulator [Patescibacteria group bacterium]